MASGLNKQAINLWGRIESRIGDILPRQAVVVEESPNGGVLVRFATEDSSLTSTWFPSTVDDAPIGTTGWVFPLAGGKGLFVAINTPIPQYDPGAGFPVTSVAGKTGAVTLVKADVGLGNVDNTSDANKPVSTATLTALNLKANTADLGALAAKNAIAVPTDITATGTPSATTYLRGDGQWVTPTNTTYTEISEAEITAGTGTTLRSISGRRIQFAVDKARDGLVLASSLALVATSGSYNDLSNLPTLGTAASQNSTAFATAAQGAKADTAVQPAAIANFETTTQLNARDTANRNRANHTGTQSADTIVDGTTNKAYTATEKTKLAGVAAGAEVNVNADWNAVSGDAQILNKPTLGTAAAQNTTAFATAAQGAKADTAVQPAAIANFETTTQLNARDTANRNRANHTGTQSAATITGLATVATSGAYSDLSGKPSIPAQVNLTAGSNVTITGSYPYLTVASTNTTYTEISEAEITAGTDSTLRTITGRRMQFAIDKSRVGVALTANLAAVATTGAYGDLTGKPTLGSLAAKNTIAVPADITATGTASASTYLRGDGSWAAAPVTSVAGRTGAITLTKTDVGLSSVDNTSDVNKPVSTATQTALNAKLNLTGGTVSGAINTTAGGAAGAGTQTLATTAYIQSRGTNLVTNGFGLLKNNYNFSNFTFEPSDSAAGGGSFKKALNNQSIFSDELLPIDPNSSYVMKLFAKELTGLTGTTFYAGFAGYDIDGNSINAYHHMFYSDTNTTLAADLKPGDTEVKLTSAANWKNAQGGSTHQRTLIIWNYANSTGYVYPPNTYSRHAIVDAWADGSVDYGTNTITLRTPFTSSWGVIPAGTAVSNGNSGGNYKYIAASNAVCPTSWGSGFWGKVSGTDFTGTNQTYMFPPGSAFAKLFFIANYFGGVQGGTQAFSAISFTEVLDEITTGEIDSGSGTTLRSITPRRAQYIVEKAQRNVPTPTLGQYAANKTYVDAGDTAAKARANHTGTQSADTVVDGTTNKVFTATEKTKLAGIATGATANDTDANLKNRANHTGTQSAATITGLATVATSGSYNDLSSKPSIPAQVNLTAGSNVTITGSYPYLTVASTNTTYSEIPESDITGGSAVTLRTLTGRRAGFMMNRANHTGTQTADTITDGTTNKAYTATEKTKLSGIATGATANSSDATLLNRANHTGTQAAATITGLATVATSGSYNDLSSKPSIPAQVNLAAGSNVTVTGSYPYLTIAAASAPVASVAGKTGTVTLAKADVGLGNVDNTSDTSKPISTATQTALNLKQPKIIVGTCATAAATAAKVVTISGYTLSTGDILAITYTSGSTVSSPTLNVNSTGAKAIYIANAAATSATHTTAANGVILYYYNGTRFDMLGSQANTDTNTTYSAISEAELDNAASTTARLLTGQRTAYIISKAKAGLAKSTTFDVRDYGTIGAADDSATFQAAINAAHSAGGGVVSVPAGTYTFTNGIYLKHKVSIAGPSRASCYLDFTAVTTTTAAVSALGTKVAICTDGSFSNLPNLASNVAKDAMTVTFASAHGLAVGDWFAIYNPTDYSFSPGRADYRDGQFCQVKAVSGNTVTLTAPTFSSYPSADCTCHKMAPMATGMSNISVKLPVGFYGAYFDACTSLDLDNCEFSGSNYGALFISRSVMVALSNPRAWSLEPKGAVNLAYGLVVCNSQHISITNPFFSSDRHGMATGSSSGVACVPVRDLTVVGGTISTIGDTTFGGDTHGNTEHCWLIGVTYPRGLHVAGNNWHIVNCDIGQAPAEGRAFYGSDLLSYNVEIRNCKFRANSTIGGNGLIEFLFSDTCVIDDGFCDISGRIDIGSYRNAAGTSAYGLYLNSTSAVTGDISVNLTGTASSSSWGNSILGCYIRATGTGSIHRSVRVTAQFQNMGVNVQNSNDVTVENCIIKRAPSQGIRVWNMGGTKPVIRSRNNVVSGCGNAGIQLQNIGNSGSSRIMMHGDEVLNCNQIGDTSTTTGANIYLYGAQYVSYRDVFTGSDESPVKATRADAIHTVGTLFQSPAAIIGGLAQLRTSVTTTTNV